MTPEPVLVLQGGKTLEGQSIEQLAKAVETSKTPLPRTEKPSIKIKAAMLGVRRAVGFEVSMKNDPFRERRNAKCSCKSGKKFKNCCGKLNGDIVTDVVSESLSGGLQESNGQGAINEQ